MPRYTKGIMYLFHYKLIYLFIYLSKCLFLSDQNADDCVASPQICDANAVCENIAESHICICKPGFAGNGKICAGTLFFL